MINRITSLWQSKFSNEKCLHFRDNKQNTTAEIVQQQEFQNVRKMVT